MTIICPHSDRTHHAKGMCKSCYSRDWRRNHPPIPDKRKSMLEYNGEIRSVREWADKLSIKASVISGRLTKKWSIERALATPMRKTK